VLLPGEPRVLSIPEMAEQMLESREPVLERVLGCSGAQLARLILLRGDLLATHSHAEADEMIYVVAGDALVTVGSLEQQVGPGWFSVMPRTVAHTILRRSRNPVIVLSVLSGEPCPISTAMR
jgi:uncharacterized cupin superfamily protein